MEGIKQTPIKILPHHVPPFMEAFYFGWPAGREKKWYDDDKMKDNAERIINFVVKHPDALIQIVGVYDDFCKMCPNNKFGNNYDKEGNDTCTAYDAYLDGDLESSLEKDHYANLYGLKDVYKGKPISSKQFFELMREPFLKLYYKKTKQKVN